MARFDGFVLLAEMRTGSNFLEESLNLFDGLTCHGEAFNPGFVGHHDRQELFGMDRVARDADPLELMRRIFERSEGIGGFRLFHDHAPEVLEAVLTNPRIAKLHLTRNPVDTYVSLKIANTTGQWRLTDERHRLGYLRDPENLDFRMLAGLPMEDLLDLLAAFEEAGFTDIIVRNMHADQAEALATIERLADVKRQLHI